MSKDIKKNLAKFCEEVIKGKKKIEDIGEIFKLVEYAELEIKLAYSSLVKSSLNIAITEYAEDILGFDRAIKHYENRLSFECVFRNKYHIRHRRRKNL